MERLMAGGLENHPDLVTGKLDNGLSYVILPNKTPPKRFEAHLEVHAGSVDEKPDEQVWLYRFVVAVSFCSIPGMVYVISSSCELIILGTGLGLEPGCFTSTVLKYWCP
jgi:hypothetical protein